MTDLTEIEMTKLNGQRDNDVIENIPEQRIVPSASWSEEKQRIFQFFQKFEDDGYVDLTDLRSRILSGDCYDIPYNYQKIIMDNDDLIGQVGFDKFYEEFRKKPVSIKKTFNSYCDWVMPKSLTQPKRRRHSHRRQRRSTTNRMFTSEDMVDGPYEDEMRKVCPPPVFIFLFTVIELAVFLSDVWYHYDRDPSTINQFGESLSGPFSQLFLYNPHRRYEAWRFLTYMFVHRGVAHIAPNLGMQLLLGLPLEVVNGWRVIVVYLCGVLAGSLSTSISSPQTFLVGASAGVYALLTSYLAIIFLNWNDMDSKWFQLVAVLVFIFFDIGSILCNGMNQSVGYMAHLFGGVTGILIGIGILRNLDEQKWERIVWWICIAIFLILLSIGVLVQILCPDYFPEQYY